MADRDPIDPRLQQYASSLPPHTLSQSYPSGPALSTTSHQPYYLPTPIHPHQHTHPSTTNSHGAPLAPAAPPNTLDPALEQPSPVDHREAEPDDDDDEPEGDHDGTLATPGSAKSHGDLKRPRACDSCRGLKVRCDLDRPDLPCRRCAKANRTCITTPPTRKRQKKADSRVAELERKIDALTATLHAQKGASPTTQHHGGIPQYNNSTNSLAQPEGSYRFGSISHDWSNAPHPPPPTRFAEVPPGYGPAQNLHSEPEPKRRKVGDENTHATIPEDMDAIHRDLAEHPEMKRTSKKGIQADYSYINGLIDNLMSPDVAERIFLRYTKDICPHFPAVPLCPGIAAREVREKKPLLFLAIVAGSSHGSAEQLVSQEVQRELTKLLKDQFADIIWRNGEKSLEIVQALQLGVLWYRPPLHYEQHNFYMMVNCAAVMALDLGLGRRATPNIMKLGAGPFRRCHPNSSSIESRRAFLVCYYLCMSITMVLRRPILLRWTKYMDESLSILESSPDALPSDKILCQHVKMAHIGENISTQFCMDDPSVEVAISEPKVIYALKIFENELQQLRTEDTRMEHVDPALRLAEHVTNLYIHEIALHHNQSAADFQPPFPSESFASGVSKIDSIGPAHIGALGECLTATHGILDTILSIPLDVLLTLPVIFCVRAIYAIVCLMKMWVSVTTSNEVGSIIKQDHLQIESYTEQLVKMFESIVSRDAQSPHGKFYFVAKRLQDRFSQIKEGTAKTEDTSDGSHRAPNKAAGKRSKQSSANQTPLHLLSEVAMGNSSASTTPMHAVMQAQSQHSQQPITQGWYPGVPPQQPDMMGVPQGNFDPNFDFTQFDLSMGSDADLSALFIPDGLVWNFAPDPGMPYAGAF